MPHQTPQVETVPSPIDFDALAREFKPKNPPTRQWTPDHQRPRYPAEVHEEAERVARAARDAARAAAPAMGITRLDIPFWDICCLALKLFIAQAIIGAVVGLIVYLVLISV